MVDSVFFFVLTCKINLKLTNPLNSENPKLRKQGLCVQNKDQRWRKKRGKENGERSIQALRNTLGSLATLCFFTLYMHFVDYPDPVMRSTRLPLQDKAKGCSTFNNN